MSRIGKLAINIPSGVKVFVEGRTVKVTGPKGELSLRLRSDIELDLSGDTIKVVSKNKQTTAYWGTTRALLANAVRGVSEGFERGLELVGVGYRVQKSGNNLSMTLGFSHPVEFAVPDGIDFEVVENNIIKVRGIDRQLVGQTAAKIRKIRKPEPYLGKGIKYDNEVIRRKAGKSVASA